MAFDDINLGTSPTGAGGDSVRAAFEKTNANFQAMLDQLDQRAAAQLEREKRFSRLVESLHGGLPALRADLRGQSYAAKDGGVLLPVEYPDVFSLTRPGPTTVWDANGNLVTVPSGEPAFDHDPVTGEALGQQIVAFPVTNLARNSGDVALWANGSGLTAGTFEGNPAMYETAESSSHAVMLDGAATDGENYARMIVAKPIGRRYIGFAIRGFAGLAPSGNNYSVYDFENDEWAVNGIGVDVVELRDGYRMFTRAGPASNPDNNKFGAWATDSVNINTAFPGDPSKGISVLRGQYQLGNTFTVYIPTDGTAATRPADVLNILNLDEAPWFSAAPLTIFLHAKYNFTIDDILFSLTTANTNSATSIQCFRIRKDSAGNITATLYQTTGAALSATTPIGFYQPFTEYKIAVSLGNGKIIMSINGQSWEGAGTVEALPYLKANFGPRDRSCSQNLMGHWIDGRARTSAELDAITGADA